MDVIERVPFGFVEHAFDLRFNHLVDGSPIIGEHGSKTFLQLIYKFGTDEEHFEEYEVLIPTYKVEREIIESELQA